MAQLIGGVYSKVQKYLADETHFIILPLYDTTVNLK